MEETDPVKNVLFIKRGGNGDRRGRPKLRWYDELEKDIALVGCGILSSQERSGGSSLKRSSHPEM
jgi:hypothetical protein